MVSVSGCQDYDMDRVRLAVGDAVSSLGGMEKFVKPGEKVLIKVNLLFPSKPEEAVTTHPSVVKAVIELVEKAGGKAIVGDSPGLTFTEARLEKTYRKCGMYDAIEGTKAELNWNIGTMMVDNPNGHIMKSLELVQVLDEVDKVIALPKPKTHSFTTYTGATKVLYGLMPGLVKAAYHSKLPDVKDFANMLLDIQEYVKADLFIMDAVIGMDGKGPSGGDPVKVGAILASANPLAMDIVTCNMVGIDPATVPTISKGVSRKLTTGKLGDIDVVGAATREFPYVKFRPAISKGLPVPRFLLKYMSNMVTKRPVPTSKCIACGACVMGCPRNCIRIVDGRARVEYSKCIRCYCCHELCPERAIELK
jgi:uncharacterized protein (DUF362 family)/Pyruvate/2-oxoacid:ferredoxin oxidoreductase delta subunit